MHWRVKEPKEMTLFIVKILDLSANEMETRIYDTIKL